VHFDRACVAAPSDRDEGLERDHLLASYREARQAKLDEWLHMVAERQGDRSCMLVTPLNRARDARAAAGWTPLARVAGGVSEPEHAASGAAQAGDIESRMRRFVEAPAAAALALPFWRPAFDEAGDVVRLVAEAAAAGVRFFDFEGLHETPPDALTWLKQAVRFARRRG
jgi:hypothetical protein